VESSCSAQSLQASATGSRASAMPFSIRGGIAKPCEWVVYMTLFTCISLAIGVAGRTRHGGHWVERRAFGAASQPHPPKRVTGQVTLRHLQAWGKSICISDVDSWQLREHATVEIYEDGKAPKRRRLQARFTPTIITSQTSHCLLTVGMLPCPDRWIALPQSRCLGSA